MNKTILTTIMAFLTSVGGWAYEVNDVVYAGHSKFVINSDNMVSHEEFETDYGSPVSLEAVCPERSYYYVSYDIRSGFDTGTRQSLPTKGSKNCYRVYLENTDGSVTEVARPQNYYDDRWKMVSYAVVGTPGAKIKIEMTSLLTGDSVRNISIHQATGYGDDRPLLEEIAHIERIIAHEGIHRPCECGRQYVGGLGQ